MSSSDMKKAQPTLISSENYMSWAASMQSLLKVLKVWRYTSALVVAPVPAQGGPTQANSDTWQERQDLATGTMTFYVSGMIQQNIINIGNANTMWTHFQETYGTPSTAGIYVEFKCAINLRICKNEDPMPCVNKLRTIFSYLAMNGLTLLDNAQAMMLLLALPHEWEGFASTLLMTLPAAAPAGAAAGTPFLNFSMVLPKIQEEWSCHSGRSIMPKQANESIKREQNVQAGLSRPHCKKCSGRHNTSDHRDNYKHPNAPYQPQTGPSQPKNFRNQPKKGKGKGKGGRKKKQQNVVEQTVSRIIELDSDDETDDGYNSTVANAGWSTNASAIPSG